MQQILLRDNKIDRNRKHFWVIGLENNSRILFIELVSLGSVNKIIAEPIEVFSFALQKRAAKIILYHNHPSGELKPSEEDKDITDRLIQVGIIVDTKVLDYLTISERSYLSFKDIELMDELKRSTKYIPHYVLEERIRKEEKEIATRKNTIEIAKQFKRNGADDEMIVMSTGLTIEEVQKLKIRKKQIKKP